jgi:hypothetical protein
MHAGLHSPVGDTKANRHFGQPKPEVVVEDQDGALLDGETPKGALELVPLLNVQVLVRPVHGLGGKEPDAVRPAPATPGLGVAGVGQDPVEPGLEELGVSQGADFAPAAVSSADCTASSARSKSRRILNAIAMHRSPVKRARASKASRSPRFAWSTSSACTHPSGGPGRVASYLAALGLESPDAAYRFNL